MTIAMRRMYTYLPLRDVVVSSLWGREASAASFARAPQYLQTREPSCSFSLQCEQKDTAICITRIHMIYGLHS